MDIERFKKLSIPKIEAGKKTKAVRNEIKTQKIEKQDAYEGTSELLKPVIDVEKSVKQSIDIKQDKMIEKLKENQKAITSGFENLILYAQLPEINYPTSLPENKLPIDYKPAMMTEIQKQQQDESDLDKGFNLNEIEILIKYEMYAPSDVFKALKNKKIDFDEYDKNIGKLLQDLGSEKGGLSGNKKK